MSHRRRFALLALALLVPSSVLEAGPMMPPRQHLSDETIGLANIRKISIAIADLPVPLTRAGLTDEAIEASWREALTDAEYDVVSADRTATQLRLVILSATDDAVPEGVAYSINLQVLQRVHVERLERTLALPTHNILVTGLESRSNVAGAVRNMARRVVARFIALSRSATDDLASAGEAAGGKQ